MRTARSALIVLVMALVLGACGTDTTSTTQPPPTDTSVTTTTSLTPATTTHVTVAPTTTTSAPGTTTTSTAVSTTTTKPPLGGEPIDIGPVEGDVLAVVGVEYDDVLNVRELPGTNQAIVTTLPPLFDDVVAEGEAWRLSRSIWVEVTANGVTGWVNLSFLAYLGVTDDVTSALIAKLGTTPEADTMLELGMIVAEASASEDPPSRLAVVKAPSVGDLGEVTIDVIGLGDDAVYGVRLVVFGTPSDGGFVLKSVEQTTLCARGSTGEGLCP